METCGDRPGDTRLKGDLKKKKKNCSSEEQTGLRYHQSTVDKGKKCSPETAEAKSSWGKTSSAIDILCSQ